MLAKFSTVDSVETAAGAVRVDCAYPPERRGRIPTLLAQNFIGRDDAAAVAKALE